MGSTACHGHEQRVECEQVGLVQPWPHAPGSNGLHAVMSHPQRSSAVARSQGEQLLRDSGQCEITGT